MKLQQIIDKLRYGELLNTSWDCDDKLPKVITAINSGLIDLASRFPLEEKQVLIQQYPQISIYKLSKEFARSNKDSSEPHKYILDTVFEPFTDDVLLITDVCDETGSKIPLNDENRPDSIFLISYNQIQIPNANEENTTFVIYRKSPKYIDPHTTDLEQDIDLPAYLLEALCAYVAFKDVLNIGGQEGLTAFRALEQRYLTLCDNIHAGNLLQNNVMPTNIKPILRNYI